MKLVIVILFALYSVSFNSASLYPATSTSCDSSSSTSLSTDDFEQDFRDWFVSEFAGEEGTDKGTSHRVFSRDYSHPSNWGISEARKYAYQLLRRQLNRQHRTAFKTIPWHRVQVYGLPPGASSPNPYYWDAKYIKSFFDSPITKVSFTLVPKNPSIPKVKIHLNQCFNVQFKKALYFLGLKKPDHMPIDWTRIAEFAPSMVLSTHKITHFTEEDRRTLNEHIINPAIQRGLIL